MSDEEGKKEALEVFSHRVYKELEETREEWLSPYHDEEEFLKKALSSIVELHSSMKDDDKDGIRKHATVATSYLLSIYDRNNI